MTICKICRSIKRKQKQYSRIDTSKRCRKCLIVLDAEKFSTDITSKDGLQTYCKSCQKNNASNYYSKAGIF